MQMEETYFAEFAHLVAREPATVYRILTNPALLPRFNPRVVEVEHADGEPGQTGCQHHLFLQEGTEEVPWHVLHTVELAEAPQFAAIRLEDGLQLCRMVLQFAPLTNSTRVSGYVIGTLAPSMQAWLSGQPNDALAQEWNEPAVRKAVASATRQDFITPMLDDLYQAIAYCEGLPEF